MTADTARIGLTGGIGSGKSAAGNFFRNHGVSVFDADQVARQLSEPGESCFAEIIRTFGNSILDQQGRLDRKALGQIVFSDPGRKADLESILHPAIRSRMDELVEQADTAYCVLEIPLLIETGQYQRMDRVVVVTCDTAMRIERLHSSRDMPEVEARGIIDNQISDQERIRHADDVLDNNGSLAHLGKQVKDLVEDYNRRYSSP